MSNEEAKDLKKQKKMEEATSQENKNLADKKQNDRKPPSKVIFLNRDPTTETDDMIEEDNASGSNILSVDPSPKGNTPASGSFMGRFRNNLHSKSECEGQASTSKPKGPTDSRSKIAPTQNKWLKQILAVNLRDLQGVYTPRMENQGENPEDIEMELLGTVKKTLYKDNHASENKEPADDLGKTVDDWKDEDAPTTPTQEVGVVTPVTNNMGIYKEKHSKDVPNSAHPNKNKGVPTTTQKNECTGSIILIIGMISFTSFLLGIHLYNTYNH
ncbi:uncharacterized protein LOC124171695 [Ischnura elegans]|uniref:uncharacterized protein LOC124171695 n=1 Tax=Ischnura elegans TaxID=197161 RepID=UPI001ED8A833|nr:uncharacterized protein LOC124171695 [Ischnura elegans]XP_046406910.1 uncharacterized protein LOC124171695 [Ischnura elegans]